MDEQIQEAIALYKQALEQGDVETAQKIKAMLAEMGIDVDDILGGERGMEMPMRGAMGPMAQRIQSMLSPGEM